jgi:hypothetical protein
MWCSFLKCLKSFGILFRMIEGVFETSWDKVVFNMVIVDHPINYYIYYTITSVEWRWYDISATQGQFESINRVTEAIRNNKFFCYFLNAFCLLCTNNMFDNFHIPGV